MADKDKDKLKKISPLTLGLIVGSAVAVAAVALGVLYPQYRRIQLVKKDRVEKTIRLEEQKRLFPIYAQADRLANREFEPQLPCPEREAMPRNEITTLSTVFNNIAMKGGMTLEENSLDISGLDRESGILSMDVKLKGGLFNFRECLILLAELPYFKGIENIDITTDQSNVRQCGATLKIAVEKNQTPKGNS
ncbi:MAG: hypothetical protein HUN04_14255 [Desulfobacter sp.]|nr:MAG: hypothetical protein HUN04_14255 [Desulfobacter sp.]